MAMASATLQADLQTTFLKMNDILDGSGDRYMADNVAKNIKDYILTGKTSTTDTGAASSGSYSGSGSGTMTIDDSALADNLYGTFTAGYDNDGIAEYMAADIDAACSADDTVAETTQGTLATSGGPSPYDGNAKGKFSGTKSTIEVKLKSCFAKMDKMTTGGNEFFAAELASAVDSYLKKGQISVALQLPAFVSGSGRGQIA